MLSSAIVAEQDSVRTPCDLLACFRKTKREVERVYVESEMDCRGPLLDFLFGVAGIECAVPMDQLDLVHRVVARLACDIDLLSSAGNSQSDA